LPRRPADCTDGAEGAEFPVDVKDLFRGRSHGSLGEHVFPRSLPQRATVHPSYGEQVIDDLTPEEADAFLDAVLG
jgi:hypothetical protein